MPRYAPSDRSVLILSHGMGVLYVRLPQSMPPPLTPEDLAPYAEATEWPWAKAIRTLGAEGASVVFIQTVINGLSGAGMTMKESTPYLNMVIDLASRVFAKANREFTDAHPTATDPLKQILYWVNDTEAVRGYVKAQAFSLAGREEEMRRRATYATGQKDYLVIGLWNDIDPESVAPSPDSWGDGTSRTIH